MFDENCIVFCGVCDCVSYRYICCGNLACNGGGCGDCHPLANKVWAWLDDQNIDKETLKNTGIIKSRLITDKTVR